MKIGKIYMTIFKLIWCWLFHQEYHAFIKTQWINRKHGSYEVKAYRCIKCGQITTEKNGNLRTDSD